MGAQDFQGAIAVGRSSQRGQRARGATGIGVSVSDVRGNVVEQGSLIVSHRGGSSLQMNTTTKATTAQPATQAIAASRGNRSNGFTVTTVPSPPTGTGRRRR